MGKWQDFMKFIKIEFKENVYTCLRMYTCYMSKNIK